MKIAPVLSFVVFAQLAASFSSHAAIRYVDVSSANPTPPYLSWSTAAMNIQDAVDVAVAGDQILVTNGVYAAGGYNDSRVSLLGPVSVRSINGPQFTIIQGGLFTRCAYLRDNNASLSGFTLTNGAPHSSQIAMLGGGVYCWGTNAVVSDCVIVGCSADYGGGVYGEQGCKIINCTVLNNSAANGDGGGVAGTHVGLGNLPGCILINCTLANNSAARYGGGACGVNLNIGLPGRCLLVNCTLTNNSAFRGAAAYYCSFSGCNLSRHYAGYNDSSLGLCQLTNCEVALNIGSPASNSQLYNCTFAENVSGLISGCIIRNSILYDSQYDASHCDLSYCCTYVPTEPGRPPAPGIGNIAVDPLPIDLIPANFRLQSNSPCINSGNNAYAPTLHDLAGNPRIVGGTVDIGAYEFQSPSSVLSYAWAQQYGLSTDGSADYADADNDRMNNWQEWIAGTVPTDAASALRLLSPSPNPSGAVVTWESVSNRTYFLERTTNIGGTPFSLAASNILGQAGTTSFTDTNATGAGPFFYRVGVQQ